MFDFVWLEIKKLPAIEAVKKQTMLPEMKALIAALVISLVFSGAMLVKLPIKIPTDAGLENPQRAYVAIAWDRSDNNLFLL